MLPLLLMLLASCIYLGMQVWLLKGWQKVSPSITPNKLPPISVVICAKDEAENLQRNLPSILQQNYKQFELLVVLDRCKDHSKAVLQKLQANYPQLSWLEIEATKEGWAGKKYALHQGIQAAQYDALLLTDADCEVGENWLQEAGKRFANGAEVILGIGMYRQYAGWLNRFIQFETFYTAFQYIGFAMQKLPYMGVGRNLGYRKSFYQANKGLTHVKEVMSGDDDLFVNAYGEAANIAVMIQPSSHTLSEPKRSFQAWRRQKLRHLSASIHYSARSQFWIGLFHASHAIIYSAMLWTFFFPNIWPYSIGLYLVRLLLSWRIFCIVSMKIQEKKRLVFFPVLDILFFLYNSVMVPAGLIFQPKWQTNQHHNQTKTSKNQKDENRGFPKTP